MRKFMIKLQNAIALRDQDEGATMVEYGLVVSLIALVVVAALGPAGQAIKGIFDGIVNAL